MKRLLLCLLLLISFPALAQKPPINGVAGPTTSAQLQSIITDATGSGPLNFGTSEATITVGTTTVASGTNGSLLYNNAGVLGNLPQSTFSTKTGSFVAGNVAQLTTTGVEDSGVVLLTQLPARAIWGNNSSSTGVPAALTFLTLGNGTAAAPAYSFGASTGTGLYSPTTNYAGIAAGGNLGVQIRNTDATSFMEYIYSGQVIWRAQGGTSVDATYAANGTGNVYLQNNGAGTNGILGRFSPAGAAGAANNYLRFTTGATGSGPVISPVAQGTGDTNIPINVDPLGSGALQTTATLFKLGGTSASFPALKRSTTAIQVRLADDSNYAPLAASGYSAGATAGIASCTVVTAGATITITGGIITAFTGC